MQHGLGVKTWSDGSTYDGGWQNKKQHGYGYFTSENGTKRNGEWQDGERIRWIGDVDEPR